ncbi:ABC transporter ATP-binding protein [Chloroflexota bacterium]
MSKEALKIKDLCKNFSGLSVLKDLSLIVWPRERVAIIGPNGAGKTTLLNVISGELPSSSGQVYVFGQEISTMPTHERIHLGIGRSFQLNHLFINLSVLENVLLSLHGIRPSRYQILKKMTDFKEPLVKANNILKSLNLWDKKDDPIHTLSYGEQRKMEIALSIASEPKILLLDEPSAGLAMAEVPPFINMIESLSEDTTVLFSAHDMDVVFGLADRVVVLYYGQIIAQGTYEVIQADSKVREIYLGIEDRAADA